MSDGTLAQGQVAGRLSTRARRDYTQGNLLVNILLLAWPMVLDMASLSVYQLVDAFYVGKLGAAALAAVSISSTLSWVLNAPPGRCSR